MTPQRALDRTLTPLVAHLRGKRLPRFFAWGLLWAAIAWSWHGSEIPFSDLLRYSGNMWQFAKDFFPPDFSEWRLYLKEMVLTIQIAV